MGKENSHGGDIYSPIPANFIKEFRGMEQQPLGVAISLWNLIFEK